MHHFGNGIKHRSFPPMGLLALSSPQFGGSKQSGASQTSGSGQQPSKIYRPAMGMAAAAKVTGSSNPFGK